MDMFWFPGVFPPFYGAPGSIQIESGAFRRFQNLHRHLHLRHSTVPAAASQSIDAFFISCFHQLLNLFNESWIKLDPLAADEDKSPFSLTSSSNSASVSSLPFNENRQSKSIKAFNPT